jgi:RimJ/RimL family protein N-acetyltransferase
MKPVVLTGERVTLVSPTKTDIDRIAELCQDPAVAAWTTVPSPYERSHAASFVTDRVADGWASGRTCTWGIRVDDALVGMIGLEGIQAGEAEIGFWLAPEARGAGVMSEATALVVDYGFAAVPEGLGLIRIVWRALVGNAASAAVARRAGFRWEGLHRLGALQRGERYDEWYAALLATDPRVHASDWPDQTYVQLGESPR